MYATTIGISTRASGTAAEQLKLDFTTVISSTVADGLAYVLAAGQEVDILTAIGAASALTYYVIRSSAPISVAVTTAVGATATYGQPAGTLFAFAAPLGTNCTNLRIKAPANITAPISVTIQIGAN